MEIAQLKTVQVLDFGLMDFVSAHHGAIAAANMRSPASSSIPHHPCEGADRRGGARAWGRAVAQRLARPEEPYNVFRDAWRARNDFGFLRMWSIHPSQIAAHRRCDEARPG